MITLTLPDGSTRDVEAPLTGAEFAASISNSLAKKALALKLDGVLVDLGAEDLLVFDAQCLQGE